MLTNFDDLALNSFDELDLSNLDEINGGGPTLGTVLALITIGGAVIALGMGIYNGYKDAGR